MADSFSAGKKSADLFHAFRVWRQLVFPVNLVVFASVSKNVKIAV
jgi:hypothetical protein